MSVSRRSKSRGPLISLLVVVSMFAGACSSAATPATRTAASGSTSTSSALSGSLVVWDFNYGTDTGKSYAQVDKNFMAKFPGVTIQHVAQPAGQYGQVIQAAFAEKSGPDVVMLQTPFAIKDYYSELVPLNDLLPASFKSQFAGWGGMNPNLDPNGQVYGIPYSFGGTAFYFNKALWRKAGLDPNNFPTTYSGLVAALQKVKAAGIIPISGGDKSGVYSSWWLDIAIPGEMSLKACYGLGDGSTKWSDPRVKDALQKYLDFIKDGFFAPNQAELYAGDFSGFGTFVDGKAALVWAFPGYRPKLAQNDATNLGTAPAVLGISSPTPNFYMAGPTLGWSIPTWSKNRAAALAYIEYITGTAAQQMHLDIDGVGPSNLNVDVSKASPDLAATFKLWKANTGNEHCGRVWQADVVAALGEEMTAVEAGQETLDQALAAADAAQAAHQ